MKFTIETISRSLAGYLAPVLPGVVWYSDPNQQGTKTPCAFLQQRYADIKIHAPSRWLRTIGLDITYLEDYNLPNMQQLYEAAAERLDWVMETFPYSSGEGSALLRTYDRHWNIDLDALHYKFELQVWVEKPEEVIPMREMDYNEEVRDGTAEI